jgi:hypothetical protein
VGELKGKSKRKDNAEAQRALRFAEKKEEDYAEFAEKRRGAKKEERRGIPLCVARRAKRRRERKNRAGLFGMTALRCCTAWWKASPLKG